MRTIWLASYPKSGNTWFRLMVANLSAKDGGPADINDLPAQCAMASSRAPFDFLTMIDSGLLTHEEIDALRPPVHACLARGELDDEFDKSEGAPPVRFVKCHDAYLPSPKGEPLLAGSKGADGAIVIVRDPRDVVASLANHNRLTIEEAVDFMGNSDAALCRRRSKQHEQFRQRLLDWSGHVASWLDQTDIPVHLVRYEDMQADAAGALSRALAFGGWPASEAQIRQAVALASFAQLREQEREKGFRESPTRNRDHVFFRRGQTGAWRDELTAEQAARIEAAHAPMMTRLGYALSRASGREAVGEVA